MIKTPVTLMTQTSEIEKESDSKIDNRPQISQSDLLLKPAIDFIHANPQTKISLAKMSQLCNISSSYFSRLFVKSYNSSFTSYVNNIKIEKVTEMLKTSDYPINYIANNFGYDDTSYFIRIFKNITGTTPAEYRKSQI